MNEEETFYALGIKRWVLNVMIRLALMSPMAGALLSNMTKILDLLIGCISLCGDLVEIARSGRRNTDIGSSVS